MGWPAVVLPQQMKVKGRALGSHLQQLAFICFPQLGRMLPTNSGGKWPQRYKQGREASKSIKSSFEINHRAQAFSHSRYLLMLEVQCFNKKMELNILKSALHEGIQSEKVLFTSLEVKHFKMNTALPRLPSIINGCCKHLSNKGFQNATQLQLHIY